MRLSGEEAGEGPPVVLLHGLTATRRYVVMGSRTLERSGYRTVAYDARGHGRSGPASDPAAYTYPLLAEDLEDVLDELEIERALLAGASMGAHTALCFALLHPERVAALGLVTPAFDPHDQASGEQSAPTPADGAPAAPLSANAYNRLAEGLRTGGVEGFVGAYDFSNVPAEWRATVEMVMRQRLSLHEHPKAVADAMEAVPRSRPFEDMAELTRIVAPTVVVASRDEVDPGHPLALAEEYARRIPGAELRVEEGGPPVRSPIAWQGGQLSKILVELARRTDFG
jgi:pimeloyl-ACP methyl ester carboxylesterase